MSRGPGRVERAIAEAFDQRPDRAFTTEDLCDVVFPGVNRVEKKHRVTVIRAAKRLADRRSDIDWYVSENLGGVLVFFNIYDVTSYAMARLKADLFAHYRGNDARVRSRVTEDQLLQKLEEGGRYRNYVVEGGWWWKAVRYAIAKRDGESALIEEMDAQRAKDTAILTRQMATITMAIRR